jgi:peptidoglycan/xylan/chitin deacetylase (PgdA/CDA1 family)
LNFNSKYHPKAFLPKLIAGKLLYTAIGIPYKPGDLLVLNYHSTPKWLMGEFEKQLHFFSNHFDFIHPDALQNFYYEKEKVVSKKPALLFTFDDGLKNNLYAAKALEKHGTRGLFFIVPDFMMLNKNLQPEYYEKHIRYVINQHLDFTEEDKSAMDETEILGLLKNGHRIGSHSRTHTMNVIDNKAKQHAEIIESKELLQKKFGIEVTNFCAPFNSLESTGSNQMKLIKSNYKLFHSTFPGSNSASRDPFFIKRTNVECFWPLDVLKFAISGFEWRRWKKVREQFEQECLR